MTRTEIVINVANQEHGSTGDIRFLGFAFLGFGSFAFLSLSSRFSRFSCLGVCF
jgi:hypothetical protein